MFAYYSFILKFFNQLPFLRDVVTELR